ncbi:protein of unknown function [Candidatus Nitrosocosmicus franklandus]|uniref:Uncharacterized protein n=1 Tax=Candidatus Nitrosocosmicus franklandianus TaxID=1798806 RepID=A0A484I6Y6_9ARCH|nr:protein of unknown function [Candidatus Nitrosocosmicus franklandus]
MIRLPSSLVNLFFDFVVRFWLPESTYIFKYIIKDIVQYFVGQTNVCVGKSNEW